MQWGMVADRDFNTSDVVVDRLADAPEGVTEALLDEVVPEEEARPQERDKIRKYDFVLPYRTPGWESRLFIQSQFYAGDSGSVSHKNVDQTKASRPFVRRLYPDAVFMEYVDGAGYFSSLNGDLKTLLSMPTTSSFLQIRSAPIRLRRALQEIGFVVPLEVEQAVARGDGSRESVNRVLAGDGYRASEVDRAIADALSRGLVTATTGGLRLADARRDIVRRYALLDTVARHGEEIRHPANATNGLLVPGFGAFYGMKLTDLPNAAAQETPGFAEELGRTTVFVDDVAWLKEQELVLTS
jgi:hypothetical protein